MSRKNVHLTDPIEARALAIIQERGFSGLSDMMATLIREEWERRHPLALHESSPPYKTSSTSPAAAFSESVLRAAVEAAASSAAPETGAGKSRKAPRRSKKRPLSTAPKTSQS